MLALAGHVDILRPVSPPFHPPHPLVSSLGVESVIDIDHPHLDNGSLSAHHEAFTEVVVPNSPSTAIAALGFAAAMVVVTGLLAPLVVPAGRGPPGGFAAALTGQDLLTRFCLSRR
ncbi:putative copper homeostasis (lipo)protein LpqS [Mycobacterium ostraviense]|nr:hypothetical protein [Mycobacterium ostraviense]